MRPRKNVRAVLVWASVVLCGVNAKRATAQEAVIYNFASGDPHDAYAPVTSLLRDAKGNLFGRSIGGGSSGTGTIYEVSPVAGGGWTEKVLASAAPSEAVSTQPGGALISDGQGNLYGSAPIYGPHGISGTVFEVSPTSSGSWTYKTLYSFGTSPNDGGFPQGSLVFDAQGNLYGTTYYTYSDSLGFLFGNGTVFELSPTAEGSWTEKILYTFGATSTDGIYPDAGLTIDSAGNLYGTTEAGGSHQLPDNNGSQIGSGTVFQLVRQSNGSWTEKILHNFNPATKDGLQPASTLILDGNGNLYGTTAFGGANDVGTVFKLSPASGGNWTETLFSFNGLDTGSGPNDGLEMDAHGNLNGTTSGGTGTVFKLVPQPDGTWAGTTVYHFPGSPTDGYLPTGGVVLDPQGNLYGVTYYGGTYGLGTVFEIGPDAIEAPTGTATTVVVSPDTKLISGEPITLTATVVAVGGTGTPSGTVTLTEPTFGHSVTVTLDQTGTAVLKGVVPFPGFYSIYAHYNGVTGFPESTSATITRTVYAPSAR